MVEEKEEGAAVSVALLPTAKSEVCRTILLASVVLERGSAFGYAPADRTLLNRPIQGYSK